MTATRLNSAEFLSAYARVSGDDDYHKGTDALLGGYGFTYDPDDGLPLSYPGERGSLHPIADVVHNHYAFTEGAAHAAKIGKASALIAMFESVRQTVSDTGPLLDMLREMNAKS